MTSDTEEFGHSQGCTAGYKSLHGKTPGVPFPPGLSSRAHVSYLKGCVCLVSKVTTGVTLLPTLAMHSGMLPNLQFLKSHRAGSSTAHFKDDFVAPRA